MVILPGSGMGLRADENSFSADLQGMAVRPVTPRGWVVAYEHFLESAGHRDSMIQ